VIGAGADDACRRFDPRNALQLCEQQPESQRSLHVFVDGGRQRASGAPAPAHCPGRLARRVELGAPAFVTGEEMTTHQLNASTAAAEAQLPRLTEHAMVCGDRRNGSSHAWPEFSSRAKS
jgi:hypothetical protein